MSSTNTDFLSQIQSLDEDFQSYMVMIFIGIILIIFIGYLIYLSRLQNAECDYMNNLYSSVDGNIRPITGSDPDCSGNLCDYYIKTAYNSCSGGSYKNNFVDICNLKAIIKQGVRCLDFEIYSVNNQPVVATSTSDSYYVKETFNSVNFGSVMDTIRNYAFSGGTCPNPTDPLLIVVYSNPSPKVNPLQNCSIILNLVVVPKTLLTAPCKNILLVPSNVAVTPL